MDTIIIKGCLNGSRGRENNPNVPWTPEEVAQEAVRCYEAGASIVHFHARTPDGGISYDPAWYAQTDAMIRAQCDLALNHTTARQSTCPGGSRHPLPAGDSSTRGNGVIEPGHRNPMAGGR